MMKKHKYFPYGYGDSIIIGYCPRTKQPIREHRHKFQPRKNYSWIWFLIILAILVIGMSGCSYKPMYDPTSSTAIAYYDDLLHCRFVAQEQTSDFDYGYNEVKYVSRCMTGRGYTILDGE
tara:strand:+ start:986 stop:1345 length:360 start_codon:yes stop_codon:yes gene_type:complete